MAQTRPFEHAVPRPSDGASAANGAEAAHNTAAAAEMDKLTERADELQAEIRRIKEERRDANARYLLSLEMRKQRAAEVLEHAILLLRVVRRAPCKDFPCFSVLDMSRQANGAQTDIRPMFKDRVSRFYEDQQFKVRNWLYIR